MKRVLLLLLVVGIACGLAACQGNLVQSPYAESDFDASGAVTLTTERSSYDISVESYTYYITNNTEEPIQFTPDYMIEYLSDGQWSTLPRSEEYQEGSASQNVTTVAPGETGSGSFSFWSYDFTVTEGTYRLIKPVGDLLCQVEFTIGQQSSGDDAYGYTPLEQLPETLDLEKMDCDLVIENTGTLAGGSEERVLSFLEQVAEGEGAMLRFVTFTLDGDPIVHDVVYENNHFLYRRDASRDRSSTEGITQRRYSYLITDGSTISLSDYASPEYASGKRTLEAETLTLLEEGSFTRWSDLTAAVEEMTAKRLETDATMARYWSEDGTYWVNLTAEPLDYTVTSKTYGMSRTLTELPEQTEGLEIVSAQWLSETQVQLNCRVSGDAEQVWYAVFDVEEETVVSAGV